MEIWKFRRKHIENESSCIQFLYNIHKEVRPIGMIVHYPRTEGARRELSERVADVYARTVLEKIKGLPCPAERKIALLDRILAGVDKGQEREGGPL